MWSTILMIKFLLCGGGTLIWDYFGVDLHPNEIKSQSFCTVACTPSDLDQSMFLTPSSNKCVLLVRNKVMWLNSHACIQYRYVTCFPWRKRIRPVEEKKKKKRTTDVFLKDSSICITVAALMWLSAGWVAVERIGGVLWNVITLANREWFCFSQQIKNKTKTKPKQTAMQVIFIFNVLLSPCTRIFCDWYFLWG